MMELQKGEGEKLSSSPSRKRAKTEEESKQEFPAAAGAKSVYLFACHLYGPNAHVLYVIDTSPLPDPSALPVDDSPMEITPPEPKEQPLDPLVEFPRAKFPMEMCAVEFDSKLYILGGKFDEPSLGGPARLPDDGFCPFPGDVHIFDPTCSSLKVGPKMNSGKFKPSAFVVDSMIYVVSGCLARPDDDSLVRFEVLKPDDDGTGGTWTRLEDPPFKRTLFTGHVVVDRQVFFSTLNGEFFCFDLDSYKWWRKTWGEDGSPCWTKLLSEEEDPFCDESWEGSIRSPFQGCPKLTEDGTLYSCYGDFSVASFGQLVANNDNSWRRRSQEEEEREEKMFDIKNFLSPDVIQIHRELACATFSLAHIGERLFCHVLFGNPLKTTTPQNWYAQDPTRCYANITMFEASEDTYYSEDKGCTFFRGKLRQSALFVITTEGCTFLSDAFTLPS
ncbi:hypothetical protein RHGRI_015844 [Rhododendron griersonianum]|uniref:Uncharacterized protein n=1 Tax=Rhododendron griersonianum TaxID=479676 RepID=A0AAV6JT24_9ERIC|nr:hypothetical protein RHGRI_015842 [Rhododendron griersonianum]KAG5542887.1 hypothetical protein RHGRI_015844 [Rhododendron griersonianum]